MSALTTDAAHVDSLKAVAALYKSRGMLPEALAAYERASEAAPGDEVGASSSSSSSSSSAGALPVCPGRCPAGRCGAAAAALSGGTAPALFPTRLGLGRGRGACSSSSCSGDGAAAARRAQLAPSHWQRRRGAGLPPGRACPIQAAAAPAAPMPRALL
jgi:hypothetical protein